MSLHSSKDSMGTARKQALSWEKIFATYTMKDQHGNHAQSADKASRKRSAHLLPLLSERRFLVWGNRRLEFPELGVYAYKARTPQHHGNRQLFDVNSRCLPSAWPHLGPAHLLCPRASRPQAPTSNFVSLWVAGRDFHLICSPWPLYPLNRPR